jgi:hypothetical protein
VTPAAENDQVLFAIATRLAPPDHVMDLELIAPAAALASPAIPLEDFHFQLAVTPGVEPKPPSFSKVATHADRLILSRNRCCCGEGRKLKNRSSDISSTSGSPFSRFAPARKSAQIISKQ